MAATYDLTSTAAILKELYSSGMAVEQMAYTDRPFLAMLSKDEENGGKYVPLPIIVDDGAGDSMDFSTAQAAQQAAQSINFHLVGKTFHGVATLTGDAIASADSSPKSFVEAIKLAVDTRINSVANTVSTSLFGSGTGTIGKIATGGITTGVITLDDPNTVVHFYKGQTLQATDTDGGTATAANGFVIAVNRGASPTVTVSATQGGAAGTPASWSATNFPFLVTKGNLNAQPPGLTGFLPSTAPSSGESFLGVDRSSDSRLYGVQFDASGKNIEEALIESSARLFREGGSPDIVIANPMTVASLAKALGSKVMYIDLKGPAGISFRAIELNTGKGTVRVVGDRDCSTSDMFELEMKSWKLLSNGKIPRFNTEDSGGKLEFIPVSNADSAELRIVARLVALGCNAPGHNCRLFNVGL